MKQNKRIYIWLPLVIIIGILMGVGIGVSFSRRYSYQLSQNNTKLNTILRYISQTYVDSVNINDLSEKAIPTIVSNLDPHSVYISSQDMQLTGSELDGHFSGIGVEFMIIKDTVTVVNVTDHGPSQAIGIKAGDRIVYANDSLFVGKHMTNEVVFKKLRGPKGTKITLKMKRRGVPNLLSFEVTRGDVPIKSVDASYMLNDSIGYIKVSRFGGTTYGEFLTAISKLKAKNCKSFIVDLRDNSGGYLLSAINMINEFLADNQLIVYTQGRVSPRNNIFSDGKGSSPDSQLVVLIDEGSASASEIFSGAIQDNDRGLIVGRRSFGKGLVQTQHVFKDGSALRLTIARYYTPSGRCIQKKYEKGHLNEYEMDLLNRYKHGEFENRDSIKLNNLPLFHTVGGRPVYGSDGILADVFVPRDTAGVNSYYMDVVNKGAVKEFTFSYTEDHRDLLTKFKDWHKAYNYLTTQPLVNGLVNYAFTNKAIRRRPYLIDECRNLLKTQLEALIIRNIYGDEGFYQIYLKDEPIMAIAQKLIEKNMATPEAINKKLYQKFDVQPYLHRK